MQQTAVYARFAYERQVRRKGGSVSARRSRTLIDIAKDFIRSLIVFLFNQVGVCVLLISYNVIGAFSFRAIEGVHGDASVEDMADSALNKTINSLWNSTLRFNVLEEQLWRKESERAVLAYQQTLVPLIRYRNYRGVRPINAWTIPGSLMYCLTVYSTIGYGNLTPRTEAGKVATVFYALLGMPLMLLYMSNLGEILAKIFKFVYFGVCKCRMNTINSQKVGRVDLPAYKDDHVDENPVISLPVPTKVARKTNHPSPQDGTSKNDWSKESIPILWCLVVMSTFVIFGGMLFARWEGWTALDGCYFCYISLSTVGFGDLVPGKILTDDDGDNTDLETIQILVTIYLLVGMALVAMCYNLMQEGALQSIKAFGGNLGCFRRAILPQDKLPQQFRKDLQGTENIPLNVMTVTNSFKKSSKIMNCKGSSERQTITKDNYKPYNQSTKVKKSMQIP